jgi:ligand-binding sensor domain-containing protein
MFSAVKLVAAAAIVALFGGFLLAGILSMPEDDVPVPAIEGESPVATGFEILTMVVGEVGTLGVDGQGVLWSHEQSQPGRLVRFVPGTDGAKTWSIEDDRAFGMVTAIAPSVGPGVWLVGPDQLRLFDGERFVEVVEAPETITLAVEAPDAALWVATESGNVLRWDGSDWEDLGTGGADPPITDEEIDALTVDSSGRPWIGLDGNPLDGVSVRDGSDWTTYDTSHAAPLTAVNSITEHPDGSIWVATESGLARFDGSAWTDVTPGGSGTSDLTSVLATPDGNVWVGRAGRGSSGFGVWRFDGSAWVEYGSDDGLSASEPLGSVPLASVGDRVYVATHSGAYVFMDGRWESAWELSIDQFGRCCELLAVDGDQLWVGGEGLWHYEGGSWTPDLLDEHPTRPVHDLTLASDGTIWAAASDGISRREDDRWVVVDETPAVALSVDAEGTVWGTRESAETEGDCQLWRLRVVGEDVVRDDIAGCPLHSWYGNSLAVDGDGVLWVGAPRMWLPGGLARYDGDRWEVIDEIDGAELHGSTVLGSDPDGAMWVVFEENVGSNIVGQSLALTRFEGTDATVVEFPLGYEWGREVTLAPDGSPWATSERGPARWDGQRWVFPYEDVAVPGMSVAAVAPDGSVFGTIGESIYRLPPRLVAPAVEPSRQPTD